MLPREEVCPPDDLPEVVDGTYATLLTAEGPQIVHRPVVEEGVTLTRVGPSHADHLAGPVEATSPARASAEVPRSCIVYEAAVATAAVGGDAKRPATRLTVASALGVLRTMSPRSMALLR